MVNPIRLLVTALALAAGIALATPAWACTLCSCSASSTSMSFGSYDPTSPSPKDSSATISIDCSGLVALFGSVEIQLSPGVSGSATARKMAQGSSQLSYNLYTDNARSSIWGNGSGGTLDIVTALNGLLLFGTSATAYGRIPARQWVKAGSYSDNVVVTIIY